MLASRIASSAIDRILYDEDARALTICFRETGRYVYYDVPRSIYDSLRDAPSAGRAFNTLVKGRYRCAFDPRRRRFRPFPGGE